jgi:hypothetical protein
MIVLEDSMIIIYVLLYPMAISLLVYAIVLNYRLGRDIDQEIKRRRYGRR